MSRVKELMEANVSFIDPNSTLDEAAKQMKELNCGVLPVGDTNRLEGIITDRDIVLRAVAEGKNMTQERVRDYMTNDVHACSEDDLLKDAATMMRERMINRVMVKDSRGNISGILTFGRILRSDEDMGEITDVIECAVGEKSNAA